MHENYAFAQRELTQKFDQSNKTIKHNDRFATELRNDIHSAVRQIAKLRLIHHKNEQLHDGHAQPSQQNSTT